MLIKNELGYMVRRLNSKKKTFKRLNKLKKKEVKLEDFKGIERHYPSDFLKNPSNLVVGVIECLVKNDLQGLIEVVSIHLEALNKSKLPQNNNPPTL